MNIGTKIEDRYIVQEQIGNETYIVKNIFSGVKWIFKSLPLLTTRETIELLQKIRHPSLPRIFETFEIEGLTYFLLEYIDGTPLLELCDKNKGKLPYLIACGYMAAISRTIYFLHSRNSVRMLHLDIKPSNIIITRNGLPCLIDYGTAQNISESGENDIDRKPSFGTPGYTPPELIQGQPATERSDIFMIGMTLLRLITGVEPDPSFKVDAKTLTSMMPAAVAAIIIRCIMNNPKDRYGNASELACDLENLCNNSLSYGTFSANEYQSEVSLEEAAAPAEYSLENPGKSIGKSDKRKQMDSSGNRIICVWDNCQFAVELSSVLAKLNKRILLIDADLLSPGIDLLIDVKDETSRKNKLFGNSTLADLMEEYSKKRLSNETIRLFAQKTSIENLSCICGNYRMEDYEYYSTKGLVEIIKTASLGFDHVVISCGKFIYDEFTCVAQICADIIFIPIMANCMQFREFNRYINFLAGRKQLERGKILFIGYDYHPDEDLSYGTCDELCNGSFAGVVPFSRKRRMMQGTRRPYINAMEPKVEKQYLKIIKNSKIPVS